MQIEVGLGDRLGRKPAVRRAAVRVATRRSAYLTVDDDVSNVNTTRAKLPSHALCQRA